MASAAPIPPFRYNPAERGFQPSYHSGERNRCPACGHSHWYVGRAAAECAFCETALPLAETDMLGCGAMRQYRPANADVRSKRGWRGFIDILIHHRQHARRFGRC